MVEDSLWLFEGLLFFFNVCILEGVVFVYWFMKGFFLKGFIMGIYSGFYSGFIVVL